MCGACAVTLHMCFDVTVITHLHLHLYMHFDSVSVSVFIHALLLHDASLMSLICLTLQFCVSVCMCDFICMGRDANGVMYTIQL